MPYPQDPLRSSCYWSTSPVYPFSIISGWWFGTCFSILWEFHNPNWRAHIFQGGLKPPIRFYQILFMNISRIVFLETDQLKMIDSPPEIHSYVMGGSGQAYDWRHQHQQCGATENGWFCWWWWDSFGWWSDLAVRFRAPRLGARWLPDPVGRIQLQPQGSGILIFATWRLRKAWCVTGRGPKIWWRVEWKVILHTVIIEDIQELSENRSSIWNGFGRIIPPFLDIDCWWSPAFSKPPSTNIRRTRAWCRIWWSGSNHKHDTDSNAGSKTMWTPSLLKSVVKLEISWERCYEMFKKIGETLESL